MENATDTSNAVIRPPIAWAFAFVAGLGLDRLYPMPFVPAFIPAAWVGSAIFALGFVLAIWAIVAIRKAGTRVETNRPTTTIVASGPYGFTRNPIYIGMFLGQTGLAAAFNSLLWIGRHQAIRSASKIDPRRQALRRGASLRSYALAG
jgi:protein-S-isoprenylcysteine O-methyltransferase Ste14